MNKLWLNISFLYLFIIAVLGITLRLMGLVPLDFNFAYLVHTHSHVAFLGWLYNILFVILIYIYLLPSASNKKIYHHLFWITQIANLGMLLSYPIQGYGLFSIASSTLHIVCSWFFVFIFLRDAKRNFNNSTKGKLSFSFIKAALFFMVLSSFAPFSMPIVSKLAGAGSNLYYNTIYFYLHFQYNGWFTFAVLGLFFKILEQKQINFQQQHAVIFFRLMFIACIPAYFLSTLWSKPVQSIYIISFIAALIQLIAFTYFIKIITVIKRPFKNSVHKWVLFLCCFALVCFGIKNILQFLGAFPSIADNAYEIHNFIIGYLHIIFIGIISFFIIAFLIDNNEMYLSKLLQIGLFLFVVGFVSSEIILFAQAIIIWLNKVVFNYYAEAIFYFSLPMVIGIALIVLDIFFFQYKISSTKSKQTIFYNKPLSAKL